MKYIAKNLKGEGKIHFFPSSILRDNAVTEAINNGIKNIKLYRLRKRRKTRKHATN